MLKNARNKKANYIKFDGCSCHNSKSLRRKQKKSMKQRECQEWKSEIKADAESAEMYFDHHIYDGERCVNCNVNVYDEGIYGPFECVSQEESMIYSTSSRKYSDKTC